MTRHGGDPDDFAWPWPHAADVARYRDVVQGCLWEPRLRQYYGLRLAVSPDALERTAYGRTFVDVVHDETRVEYELYRRTADLLAHHRRRRAEFGGAPAPDAWLRAWALLALACLLWWTAGAWLVDGRGAEWTGRALVGGLLLGALVVAVRPDSRRRVVAAVGLIWSGGAARRLGRRLIARREEWQRALEENGVLPGLEEAAKDLLGPEWEQFLSGESFDGLRELHSPQYVVLSAAEQQLKQRMNQIHGGTIAVCGPRGAGKSTLLRACSTHQQETPRDFSVFVSAPAEYSPHEFLLALFGKVCAGYLDEFGTGVPDLGEYRPRRRRALTAGLHAFRWLVRMALALGAIAAGLYQAALWSREEFVSPQDVDRMRESGADAWASAVGFWQDHPWIVGIPLVYVGLRLLPSFRRPVRAGVSLDERCVRHLARLRTVRNTTTGTSLGLPQVLGAATTASSSTSVSSVPFTFPELVAEYRELLEAIADEVGRWHGVRVVIAIDELDRLGDMETARKFLGQIKAVFGVRNVCYLISVAEDIGAAFARRSLPHRDATDSSIDDTFYVPPRTTGESEQILARRAESLGHPFVLLAHVLSGGIPRDLIRYARRLAGAQHDATQGEERDLIRRVVQEELVNTLEGFRTLLALTDAGPGGGPLMSRLHALVRLLHPAYGADEREIEARLRELAGDVGTAPTGEPARPDGPDPAAPEPDAGGGLRHEVVVCTYFALTLLQVFGRPDLDPRRRRAQSKGPDGELDRLAEARQELAISPYSAHTILDRFRAAWELPRIVPPQLP
ncbi:P-loop NTPase fold protein [Streptomyces sp. NPDC004732]|uniref:P-loop NTPase fold protein n=1 Tax=Streptomyces sp. NPDC004732 TaxID=3154290 RepID=UPI0033BF6431